jgi:hypothetical protein
MDITSTGPTSLRSNCTDDTDDGLKELPDDCAAAYRIYCVDERLSGEDDDDEGEEEEAEALEAVTAAATWRKAVLGAVTPVEPELQQEVKGER